MKDILKKWTATTSERVKVQHTYLILAGLLIVIAGLISLLNPELGRDIVMLAAAAIGIFIVNAVMWAMLYSILYPQVHIVEPTPPAKSRRK